MKPIKINFTVLSAFLVASSLIFGNKAYAQGGCGAFPKKAFNAGSLVARIQNYGGRTLTYANGCLLVRTASPQRLYDLSNPENPRIAGEMAGPWINSHNWAFVDNKLHAHEWGGQFYGGTNFLDIGRFPSFVGFKGQLAPGLQFSIPNEANYLAAYPYGSQIFGFNTDKPSGTNNKNKLLVGNLLFAIPINNDRGFGSMASFDASDPGNIKLLDVITDPSIRYYTEQYHIYRDNILFLNGEGGISGFSFKDPTNLRKNYDLRLGSGVRYLGVKDNYLFGYNGWDGFKYDMEARQLAQKIVLPLNRHFEDMFPLPFGHLVASTSNSQGGGGGEIVIYAHQSGLDTSGPYVAYINPSNNQTNVSTKARIGVIIHEALEPSTVSDTTMIVRPLGGQPIKGMVSFYHNGTLTFGPHTPLQPNTTYQVELVAGGIRDVAGNGMVRFTSVFSTGATIASSPESTPTSVPTVVSPTSVPPTQVPPTTIPTISVPPTLAPTSTVATPPTPVNTVKPTVPGDGETVSISSLTQALKTDTKKIRRALRKTEAELNAIINSLTQTISTLANANISNSELKLLIGEYKNELTEFKTASIDSKKTIYRSLSRKARKISKLARKL
jgi:hypothetical protein